MICRILQNSPDDCEINLLCNREFSTISVSLCMNLCRRTLPAEKTNGFQWIESHQMPRLVAEAQSPAGESSSPLLGDRSGTGTGSAWSHVSPLTWCLEVKDQLEPGPAPSCKHTETAKLRRFLQTRYFSANLQKRCDGHQTLERRSLHH